ncbi:hypothetical protein MMC25_006443 [Agyrium rufum]|nr:hypothetical protein [Agyrium rufum]
MSSRIDKTIARQQEKINEGQFYEAHQQLRVIASRYIKSTNWTSAIDILYGGALALLQAGQGGSGGDLGLMMVNTYGKGEVEVTPESKGKVLAILRAFPSDEPTKKKFISEIIGWSAQFGEYANGDSELHHIAGTLYADSMNSLAHDQSDCVLLTYCPADSEPYDAERHLALGTKDSPEVLARLEYAWYKQDDGHTAALYAARAVFPYLLTQNLRSANKAFLIFTSALSSSPTPPFTQSMSSKTSDIRVYPVLPLLNFLTLLLLAIERSSADLFRSLAKHYVLHIKDVGAWEEPLAHIGEMWFGIKIPRAGNPLFDMMGSMLFGGGGGSPKPASPKPGTPRAMQKKVEEGGSVPPAVDLD